MARREQVTALCALLVFAPTAISAAPPDSSSKTSSTPITQAEKYKAATEFLEATIDLDELKLKHADERLEDQKALTAAANELALERKARIEATSFPGWVWPVSALALVGAFAAGFVLAYSAPDS